VQSLGSAVVLNGMLWVAIVVAIPLHGGNPLYATAATTGGVFLALLGSLVLALTRGEDATAHRLGAVLGKMPLLQAATVERIVHAFAARLRELSGDRLLLLRAMGWAAVNWLLDMAALWVLLAGLGHRVGLVGIMVCYGLANVLAAIPLTPGGLGVVEAALSTLLVGFSVPAETALFGVLCWRAVNFWLPIPVGGLAYASLCRSIRLTGCRELNSDSVAYCEVSAVGGPGVAVGGADDRSDTRAGGTGSNRTYSRHERVPHVLGRGHGWPAAAGDPCRRRQPDLAGTG
jgi:uncharacterized membrane protein YbhN (UPF0104 family)